MGPVDAKTIVAEESKANKLTPNETKIVPYDQSEKIKIIHTESESEDSAYTGSASVVIAAIITAEARMYMLPYRLD